MDEIEFYLEDLKSKFSKINPDEYYLAYSGGRDSHFLLWFIREYLHETRIPAVYNNTGMDIPEIRERARANADVVLKPSMHPFAAKEKYGIPLNSKRQDYYTSRYQQFAERGVAEKDMPKYMHTSVIRDVFYTGSDGEIIQSPIGAVNRRTYEALKNGTLHKVSPKCCDISKKIPAHEYEKETGRKAILGIMAEESRARKTMSIKGCFASTGKFYPIRDLTDELQKKIEKRYDIPVPAIYSIVRQTGCAGCPYGLFNKKRFNAVMNILPHAQKEFCMEYFRESYKFRGYEFEPALFT